MAALLSESARQPVVLVTNTSDPEEISSVIAFGPKVLADSPTALDCERFSLDPDKSGAASSPNKGAYSDASSAENILPASSPSSTDLVTLNADTSVDLRSSKGADNKAEGMQRDCSQVLEEDLSDEGLRKLQTDYERRREERKKEQDLAVLERQRLEEIFRICSEYDQKQEAPKDLNRSVIDERRDSAPSRSSWGSSSKIKTNGSLTSSGIYSRRSDDKIASSTDNYVGDATRLSNGRAEPKAYVISSPNPCNGDAMSHPCVINVTSPSNRIAESDYIQSRPSETGSNRSVGKSYARILKLSNDSAMDLNNWNQSNSLEARLSSRGSDLSDALKRSSTDLGEGIDDDNITTDCFQEESPFSVVSSEYSFQTTSPTLNGMRDGYHGNEKISCSPAPEVLPRRKEIKNSHWNPSESVSGQHSKEYRFQKSVDDAKERIQILRHRIIDVKNLEEKTICETQSELELLQWDYSTLIEQLQREKERMAFVTHQQMELIFEAAKEREEAERQLESERRRLEELEGRLEETRKRCLSLGIDPDDDVTLKKSALSELIAKEMEEVEHQRRLFDDLEFHLLEVETRREEEREPHQQKLAAELNQLKHSASLVEETLLQLTDQKSCLISQIKSDVIDLEKERLLLMDDYRKEKRKLQRLLNGSGDELCISPTNQQSSFDVSFLRGTHYQFKAAQRIEGAEFTEAGVDLDDDFLPKTPSSTTSVLQRLQELEYKDPTLRTFTENKDPGVSDGEDEYLGVADDQSFLSSSFSVDRLKSWLVTDHSSDSKVGFFTGSDEGASVRSMEDDLDRLLLPNNDRYSYGTGCSSQSKEEQNGNDIVDQSTDDGRHYVKNLRSSAAEGLINGVWRWSRAAAAATGASVDKRSSQPTDNGTATETVVMRTTPKVQSRPMTRYLPVRGSCDLDLRQFIESSGHRIDGNPHVHVTPSTCRGHLVKMGTKFRLWHRRWFVFDRMRRSVIYYADQSAKKVRGCVLFSAIEDVFVDHLRTVRSPSPKLTFCLKTTVKNFYLVAPSPEAMRIWIDVLFTGAEGYQGFS